MFELSPRELISAYHPLAEYMSELSEECYCAGWLNGTEYSLWDALTNGEMDWGMGRITAENIAELKRLSTEHDCWIYYHEMFGPTPVTLASWEKYFQKHWDSLPYKRSSRREAAASD